MLETYDRLSARAKTINKLNRLHTLLEVSLTPSEVLELHQRLTLEDDYWHRAERSNRTIAVEQFRATATEWTTKLFGFHQMSGKADVEQFYRKELLPSLTVFLGTGDARDKVLAIFLCGNPYMPMMPVASLLQAMDPRRVDVVVVREMVRGGYRTGIQGVCGSVHEMFHALPDLVGARRYVATAYVGLSGGGFPALLLAYANKALAAISVGGNAPSDPRWNRVGETTGTELLREVAAHGYHPMTSLLYGRESFDKPAAEETAEIIPASLFEITEADQPVGHNAFFPLLRTGRLSSFLDERLGLVV
jgi:hypothetical protein